MWCVASAVIVTVILLVSVADWRELGRPTTDGLEVGN
jgi:hypothetical protein